MCCGSVLVLILYVVWGEEGGWGEREGEFLEEKAFVVQLWMS